MTSSPPDEPGPTPFAALAAEVLEATLRSHPDEATYLGEHRFDDRLPDPSPAAAADRSAELGRQLDQLAGASPADPDEQVDRLVLSTALRAELFDLAQLATAEWNPMVHNPGTALHALISRDFAPLPQRLATLGARLAAVPGYLEAARDRLAAMSRVHLDTALAQLDGTVALIDSASARTPGTVAAAETARAAVVQHQVWLTERREAATRDPRLGSELFAHKLGLVLDTDYAPETLLAHAESDLQRVTAAITEQAGRVAGVGTPDADTVRTVLDQLSASAPTDGSILGLCREALVEATAFVRQHDLVTVHDDRVDVVEMPEIDRGVAVAYCRPVGPLERAALATEFAVSPTPRDWTPTQVRSFYREYNAHMLHNLTVHEAMPGHALQLMHANRHRGSTPVRAVWWSGSFVEGWAVYAEELMADRGYRSAAGGANAAALRMQQLKMQLRMIINAILDVRFHCADLDEGAAMQLMLERGFQERGEADGKWRRVQLSSAQLSTYYVGYREVRDVITDLRRARPDATERQVHDEVLAHGSPPARHLRTLLALG